MRNVYLRPVIMTDMGSNTNRFVPTETLCNFSVVGSENDERQYFDADNVAILDGRTQYAKENMLEPMSAARFGCFTASLLLCFGIIITFVWFVPCNTEATCPAFIDWPKTHNWLKNYTKIELKGHAHIFNSWRWVTNLIYLYRGDTLFSEQVNARRNGVISLISNSGAVSWLNEMTDEPIALDCTLIDIDRNGKPDCLLMDEYGEVGTINPMTGAWHWHFNERSASKVDVNDFPLVLPDLDNDGVTDLLIVTSISLEQRTKHYVKQGGVPKRNEIHNLEQRNSLTILSGRTGRPIGESFKFHECDVIQSLRIDTSNAINFNCLHNKTVSRKSKSLSDLFVLITNRSLLKTKLKLLLNTSQYHHSDQSHSSRNVYSLSGRELLIENQGKCPDCNVMVMLSQNLDGKGQILQNFTEQSTYGMAPVQWHLKQNKGIYMSGFIMKFWKWSGIESSNEMSKSSKEIYNTGANETFQKINNVKSKTNANKSNTSKVKHLENKFSHYNVNEHLGVNYLLHEYNNNYNNNDYNLNKSFSQRYPTTIYRDMPNIYDTFINNSSISKNIETRMASGHVSFASGDYKMHLITESVVLVIFIDTETHIENILRSKIVQFCWNDRINLPELTPCQPEASNQHDSMIVVDLDQDGYQELVTYSSTYVHHHTNSTQDGHLITYVRLMRLDLELLKYYKNEKYTEK